MPLVVVGINLQCMMFSVICNMCCAGTSLMEEVFINQEADPYVLEVDGRLDLAALQLQPAGIVINSKKGLVDAQTSKTKRSFADIQQKVLHDTTAGSKANPLKVSGASVAGKSSMSMRKCYVARLRACLASPVGSHNLLMLAGILLTDNIFACFWC
ncbi:TPA: hypothetical protein ACH3X1_010920 [Trebouxia sp. C0004]